jgi:hypothetical protein
VETISDTPPVGVTQGSVPIPGHPGYWCGDLNERLAEALIARTLDAENAHLREMTRDLARFSSAGQLERWRPGRDMLCLQDENGTLAGVGWIADKPLPERDDYFDPERMLELNPRITCAVRTYGSTHGRGLLTKAFAEYSLEALLRRRQEEASPVWIEPKSANVAARALARQLGFEEVSRDASERVIGLRVNHR